ncbi:CpsD/CapB family tyrosine-protein kinase, partial [Azospirillum sp. B506]|uniref:tyrosine-protein kinase family protein n=1 Tax=Azospirillum sp. B506 TaxID=137721 RepID=UPI001902188F
ASRFLAMKNEPGLCELLTASAALDDVIRVDPASGIHILPAGGVSGPNEGALNSTRLRQVFQTLESRYDLIVIDTAPILAVYDAQYYTDVANRVLFVVRWGQTPRDVVKVALKLLTGMGTTVDGTALTRVDTARQARYGTGEYGSYKAKLRDYHLRA